MLQRLAFEDAIIGRVARVRRQIIDSAGQNNQARERNAGAQQHAHSALDASVRHVRAHFKTPMPCRIIRIAITPTTAANTLRRTTLGSRASKRAPSSDPASTPSITGMAMPGLM